MSLAPPSQYEASIAAVEGGPPISVVANTAINVLVDQDNIPLPQCTGPTGTANVATNCGYQFGQNVNVTPKWYLDAANPTNYLIWNPFDPFLFGGQASLLSLTPRPIDGWLYYYLLFEITNRFS
jgi:hypothetical protein